MSTQGPKAAYLVKSADGIHRYVLESLAAVQLLRDLEETRCARIEKGLVTRIRCVWCGSTRRAHGHKCALTAILEAAR